MRQAPQEIEIGPAALIAARPKPELVGEEEADAPVADAREIEKRRLIGPVEHHMAVAHARADGPQPLAPRVILGVPIRQIARHGMALAFDADMGAIGRLDDAPVRNRRKNRFELRVPQAAAPDEFRTGRDQQGAAAAHVIGDVAEIALRQGDVVGEAIEDDEIEIVQLLLEKLLLRKGDEGELVDRRAVGFLRRAQDGEMHEIDRRIGFQKIAPDALAGMRRARNEKHAQPLAHALDRHDGLVVAQRQLVLGGGSIDLDHDAARVRDRNRDRAEPRRASPRSRKGAGRRR